MPAFLQHRQFWVPFFVAAILLSAFFAWEITYLPRPELTPLELYFTIAMIALLSLDSGLVWYRLKKGACPIGAKRASTIAGGLGVVTLLCPACLLVPVTIFGLSLSLTFLTPFLPLLRAIVILLLVVSTVLLWPKNG